MKGPGEKEIETDRRIIRNRITLLKTKLQEIDRQNQTQRKNRQNQYRVALVGYTNVGKSSLLNRLTKSEVFAENKLFATLDTTVRKWVLDSQPLLLSDTVGFIRKLPHHLVESFKSTLDEAREADLLLHVIDASHPGFESQIQVVDQTLVDLGITGTPVIRVYNKIDALHLEPEELNSFERSHRARHPLSVFISVKTGAGLDELRSMVRQEAPVIFS
jgi:GTPase